MAAAPELSRAAAASENPSPRYDAEDVLALLLVDAAVELSDPMLLVLLVLMEPLLVVLSEPLLLVLLFLELLDVVVMLLLALALVAGSVCMMIWTFAPVGGIAIAALPPPPLPLLIKMNAAICELPDACSKAPVHRLLPELEPVPDELVVLIVLPDELVLAAALPLSIDELLDVELLLMLAEPPLDDLKLPLQPASGSIDW